MSGALAYWASAEHGRDLPPPPPPAQAPARKFAPPQPDPTAIRRAYARIAEVYSERGVNGVMEISDGCGHAVAVDPKQLDFCIAFAVVAKAIAANSDGDLAKLWADTVQANELAVIRSALPPGADAAARWAAVEAMTRQAVRPAKAPARPASAPPAPARARPTETSAPVKARAPRTVGARTPCRVHSAPLERTLCEHPQLKAEDARMRAAYDGALARGANPERLEREQAAWNTRLESAAPRATALAKLYRSRTVELTAEHRKAWPYD